MVHRSNEKETGVRKKMSKQDFTKETRFEIYSCSFCEFVQASMGTERLDAIDEKKYLFHLKHVHNLEP
jgi:hypothetical protein